MEWMPLLTASQCANVAMFVASHATERASMKEASIMVSTFQSGPFRRTALWRMEALPFERSLRVRKSSAFLPIGRAARSPWRPAGAPITGVWLSATPGMKFAWSRLRKSSFLSNARRATRRTRKRLRKRQAGRPCASSPSRRRNNRRAPCCFGHGISWSASARS